MKNFMKASTSIIFALIIAGAFMFPVLAVAGVIAWFYIDQEYDDKDFDGFVFENEKDL